MKLFVCWSGARAHELASFFKQWLPTVVDGLDVFVSEDIEVGTPWSEAIKEALRESEAGLVCLAWESRESVWINYEAGALANAVGFEDRRLYPYLLDLDEADVPAPLQQFQSSKSTREDSRRMVRSIAERQGDTGSWINRFEREWRKLESKLDELRWMPVDLVVPRFFELFDRSTFRDKFPRESYTWLDRYVGALETYEKLEVHKSIVRDHCHEEIAESYVGLVVELREYKDAIKELITDTRQEITRAYLKDAERRRRLVLEFVKRLKSPQPFDPSGTHRLSGSSAS